MYKCLYDELIDYIERNIGPGFQEKQLDKLNKVNLDALLKKNPYLFKAKGVVSANEFIPSILDALLSSREETIFGNFLEGIAIFVSEKTLGGWKSSATGIDLEFDYIDIRYLVSIKSGPHWGNASQIKKLISDFKTAQKILRTSGGLRNRLIRCVEGCCYGIDNHPDKEEHIKLCGQNFWSLISGGDNELYKSIIVPLGHRARERWEEMELARGAKLNILQKEFLDRFCCINGQIDWEGLLEHNSRHKQSWAF